MLEVAKRCGPWLALAVLLLLYAHERTLRIQARAEVRARELRAQELEVAYTHMAEKYNESEARQKSGGTFKGKRTIKMPDGTVIEEDGIGEWLHEVLEQQRGRESNVVLPPPVTPVLNPDGTPDRVYLGGGIFYPWGVSADLCIRLGRVLIGPTVQYRSGWFYGGRVSIPIL